MTRLYLWVLLIFLVLSWVRPNESEAQVTWDAATYSNLTNEGRELYERAQQLPPEADYRRQELLLQSAEAKLAAREYLRAVIAAGVIDSDLRAQAIIDLFNLGENLIATMLELRQCEAASLLLYQLGEESLGNPPDASEHREIIRPLIQQCRLEVQQGAPDWDYQRFQQLVEESQQWREQAQGISDPVGRRDSLWESVQREQEAVNLLRLAVLSGGTITQLDDPADLLWDHHSRLIRGLVEIGLCHAARRRIALRQFDADLSHHTPDPEQEALADEVENCTVSAVYRAETDRVGASMVRDERDPWPYILLFTSAAAGVAGIAFDLSLEGERASLARIQDDCDIGPCDYERALELVDAIDQTKWVIRGVAATAIVAGVVGLVLLIHDESDGSELEARVDPLVGWGTFGAMFSLVH